MLPVFRPGLLICAIAMASDAPAAAQSHAEYRGFQLGASVESVSAMAGIGQAAVRTLHQRPALIQTFTWRPPYAPTSASEAISDPVRDVTFTFFDNQLFRMVVDYDRDRTEGLTSFDITAAIASVYGQQDVLGGAPISSDIVEPGTAGGTPVATWRGSDYAVVLFQAPGFSGRADTSHYVMVVTSPRLSRLSRAAVAEALRIDLSEAPERERAQRQQSAEADRSSAEKAREANKPAFTP